ncbi:MAG TPA: hypothetical protein VFA86_03140 [Gammaproteobacteria bacterium]|nr:hypothetical protein [Gammaproteobacteria bacterium]
MAGSNELYTIVNGRKTDAPLHEEILDNPEADRLLSEMAVQRAIEDGLSEEVARELYRYQR